MKTQTVNPTVKKRTVKRKHNDSFKGKLRGNIGKLIGLKEPQLLVKFGVEDIVPSRLVKSIIATSANKKTADIDKNIITSTPHYTKDKGNLFFNSTGSSVFSPINYKGNQEKEHEGNVSSDSEIVPARHDKRNSSVIYVCTKDGDGNALSNVLHELSGEKQDKLVNNANDSSNNPLKRISAGEPPSEPPITKKSKIPVRTASQERENVNQDSFLPQTRSKHKNIPNVTDTSQTRNSSQRLKAKERRSNSVPVKTPEQPRKYFTRVSKSSHRHSPEELGDPHVPQQNVSASKDSSRFQRSARSDSVNSKTNNNNNNNDDGGGQSRNEGNLTIRRGKRRRNQNNNNFTDTEQDKVKNQKNEFTNSIGGPSPAVAKTTDRSERAKLDKGKNGVSANNDVANSPKSVRSTDPTHKLPTKEAPSNLELAEEIKTKKRTLEEGKSREIANKEIQASNDATAAATASKTTQQTKKNRRKNITSANSNSEQLPESTGRAPSAQRKPSNNDTSLDSSLIREITLRKVAQEAKKAKEIQTSGLSNDGSDETSNRSDISKINESEKSSDLSSLIEGMKSRNIDLRGKINPYRTVSGVSPINNGAQPVTKEASSETSMSLGHILSQRGMFQKMKKWDEFCARLEGLFRYADGSTQEGESNTSASTSRNRRFSKNVESPKNATKKLGKRGAVFGFIASAKKRRSLSLAVSVPPEEKTESLHKLVGKIKSTITKNCRQTVNKEIQTTVLGRSNRSSKTPLFRRSAVRKGLGKRSCGTMLEFGDSTSSSGSHTFEGPNIYDSLKDGNPLDALDFSDIDGPDLTPVEKPWRFEDDNNSSHSDMTLNFLRRKSIFKYSGLKSPRRSNIMPRRISISSSDESDFSPNNRTLTQNDVSRGSASRTSPRKRYRSSRRDLKKYDKRNKEVVIPALKFPSERNTKSSEKVNNRTSAHNNDVENIDTSRKAVDPQAQPSSNNFDEACKALSEAEHFEENNRTQVSEETSRQTNASFRNYAKNTLRQSKEIETGASNQAEANNRLRRVSSNAKKGTTIETFSEPTNHELRSIKRKAKSGRKDIDEPAERESNNGSEHIRSSVSNEQMLALTQSPEKGTPALETDKRQNNRLSGISGANHIATLPATLQAQGSENDIIISPEASAKRLTRSKSRNKGSQESPALDSNNSVLNTNEPLSETLNNMITHTGAQNSGDTGNWLSTLRSKSKNQSNRRQRSSTKRNEHDENDANEPGFQPPTINDQLPERAIGTVTPLGPDAKNKKKIQSPEKGTPALDTDKRQNNRLSGISGANHISPLPATPQAEGSKKDTITSPEAPAQQHLSRSKSRNNGSKKIPALDSNNSVLNTNEPFSETSNNMIGKTGAQNSGDTGNRTLRSKSKNQSSRIQRSSTKRNEHDENEAPEPGFQPPTINDQLPEQAIGSVTSPALDAKNKKRRYNKSTVQKTKSCLGDVTDLNILASAGSHRPQRTRKPVKYHTDIDIESRGYILVSTVKANKKPVTSKKGGNTTAAKKTRQSTKRTNAKLVTDVVEPPIAEEYEENRTNQNNFANSELQPVDDSQMVVMPPPRVATVGKSRGRRGRKKLAFDSGYENSDSEEGSHKGRLNSNSRNTRQINKDSSSLGRELRSSVERSKLGETDRLDEENALQGLLDRSSGLLDTASNLSSALRPMAATLEINNETDSDNVGRRTSPRKDNDFVRSVNDGQVYNLRYISRPPESSFTKVGNLYISETIVDPEGSYSSGFLRLDLGGQKKPSAGYIYSLIFGVLSGTAHIHLEDKDTIVNEGEFFHIPRGMKYSIKNANSHKDLLLHYTRIRGRDA